jgi:hypothetical protein
MEPMVKAVKNDDGEHWIGDRLIQQFGHCCSEFGLPTTTPRVLVTKCVVEIFDRELAAGAVTGVDGGIVSMNLLTDRKPLVEELGQESTTGDVEHSPEQGQMRSLKWGKRRRRAHVPVLTTLPGSQLSGAVDARTRPFSEFEK